MGKYDLEPYDEILSEWYRVNKQIIRVFKGVAFYFFIILISIVASIFGWCKFPFLNPNFLIFGSVFIISGVWVYSMWQYCRISNIESKRYREIENAITPELEYIAREWYGKGWHKALQECIEAHFPGDCPLCGAQ